MKMAPEIGAIEEFRAAGINLGVIAYGSLAQTLHAEIRKVAVANGYLGAG